MFERTNSMTAGGRIAMATHKVPISNEPAELKSNKDNPV